MINASCQGSVRRRRGRGAGLAGGAQQQPQHGARDDNNPGEQLGRAAFVGGGVTFTSSTATRRVYYSLSLPAPRLSGVVAVMPPVPAAQDGSPVLEGPRGGAEAPGGEHTQPDTPSPRGDGLPFPANA